MAVCGDEEDAKMAVLPISHSRLFSSSPAPTIAAQAAICEPLLAHLHLSCLLDSEVRVEVQQKGSLRQPAGLSLRKADAP